MRQGRVDIEGLPGDGRLAGFLHDCVEDCDGVTADVIKQKFGAEVALLVDGVTKLTRLDFTSRE
ncbi:MAG: HD domain-containing protein, partial [Clostridia bacterium]|nr:HD domain-containing protein [Clostridia bacterium]